MARIAPPRPGSRGLFGELLAKFVFYKSKKMLGRAVMPLQVLSHRSKLLWGQGQMEQAQLGSHLVPAQLKNLAEIRVASLIGCPF